MPQAPFSFLSPPNNSYTTFSIVYAMLSLGRPLDFKFIQFTKEVSGSKKAVREEIN